MMLQAFFDGSTDQDNALIFAGYLGTVDTWLKFSDDWGELLTLQPKMSPFKMNEAASTGRMERAMFHYHAIERAKIFGLGCAIPIEPLIRVAKELNLDPAWHNPYYLAWRSIVTLTLEASDRLGSHEPIEFVFDDQSDKIQVIQAWDYFYNSAGSRARKRLIGSPSFKIDDHVMPLQAADFLAWWARKQYITDKENMRNLFPTSWAKGKDPDLIFVDMPEESIRKQFTRDIEAAKKHMSRICLRATFKDGEWI